MNLRYFIVNTNGFILPYGYDSYEAASAACDSNEMVYLAESLGELEYCLENQEWDAYI